MKKKKVRAVCYCRVSTDAEEQRTSIQNQRVELRRMCENKGWTMPAINHDGLCEKGVYYDVGTSGTKLSRPAFDQLLLDAGLCPVIDADTDLKTTTYKVDTSRKPLFDLIVVKDAARFSRNVSINSILLALKENCVYVYFQDLNKSTESNEDWSMIQIFFTFAESESRRKSVAVSFGYEAGLKAGKIYVGGKMFGYDYDPKTNSLKVNPEEAKVIKRVFDLYTEEEMGQLRICNQLADEGYYCSSGKKYGRSTIKRWLENEKYCGMTTGGRYHKTDLFTGKKIQRDYDHPLRVAARKAQEKLKAEGVIKIEPIISVEQFQKAKEITARNSEIYKVKKEWHGTTVYAKKVICGCCGAYYRASGKRAYAKYGGRKISRYVCKHSIVYDEQHGVPKCENPSILEPELDKALFGLSYWTDRKVACLDLIDTGHFYINVLENAMNVDNSIAVEKLSEEIKSVKEKRERLLDLYADGLFDKEELTKRTTAFTDSISKLEAKKEQLSKDNNAIQEQISEITTWIKAAEEDIQEIHDIVTAIIKKKKYPQKSRKELLRDVDHITIGLDGKPVIKFKSVQNIKNATLLLGIRIEAYNEADEMQ